jgi:hypothetical protein
MKEEFVTDGLIRQFLLGLADDQERQRIESLFITDPQSRERVLALEQDLIEEYLEDSFTPADKERFLSQYANTPTQRRKLRIAKSIKDLAAQNATMSPDGVATSSTWSRLRARLRLKPLFLIPIAATAAVAIVVASIWINNKLEQNRHAAIEEEIVRLNDLTSVREIPAQISLTLKPFSLRGLEPQPELITRADVPFVEFNLLLIGKERYPSYQAVVHRVRDNESFTIPDLKLKNCENAIRLRQPKDILTRGLYRIELIGRTPDGGTAPPEEYTLTIGG